MMSLGETSENVAERFGVDRHTQVGRGQLEPGGPYLSGASEASSAPCSPLYPARLSIMLGHSPPSSLPAAQDEFAYESQHKAAAAQEAGIFAQEIVPVHTTVSPR